MLTPLGWTLRGTAPVVCGPFHSEVGFETLYWVPWLDHLRHVYQIPAERLYILTRGGAGVWYDVPEAQRVELYDYVPPADLRRLALQGQQDRRSVKQLTVTAWERRLVDLVACRLGLRRYRLLHPSALYRRLDPWWTTQRMGLAQVLEVLRWSVPPRLPLPVGLALPERYVAVRLYQRATWPLSEGLLDWSRAMLLELAKTIPVVVLRSEAYVDDHVDFPVEGPGIRVVSLSDRRTNLAVQTAILQRATCVLATWGGIAQLAVRLGRPVVALYDRWQGVSYAHRVLTEWLATAQGTTCWVGRPWDLQTVRDVLPVPVPLPDLPRGSSS